MLLKVGYEPLIYVRTRFMACKVWGCELLIQYEVRLRALSHNETHTLSVIIHIKHY